MMDPVATNPLAALTFLVAPAILTNASAVMGMQTANRFARAIDRARSLASQLESNKPSDALEAGLRYRQLVSAEKRAVLLVRSLAGFYLAVGSFAAATIASLLSVAFLVMHLQILHVGALTAGLCCGLVGIGGILTGASLLVLETRHALTIVSMEMEFIRQLRVRRQSSESVYRPNS
jgi:hypothetical protein